MMKERGVDRLRHGGLQPRPRAGPRRRRGLRRGGLHQPGPRPPRLPRRRRGLLPRPRRRCSPPSAASAAWSTPTTSTAGACSQRGDVPLAVLLDHRRRRRLAGRGRRGDGDRVDLRGRRPGRRTGRGRLPAARRLQRGQRAGRARGLRRGGASTSPTSPARWPRAAACPAGSSGSTRGRTSPSSSTTRTSPTPSTAALAALRPLTDGRLIVVLGAGGERDPGKRPIMGEIAAPAGRRPRGDRRQPARRGARRHPGRDPGRHPRRHGRGARGRRPTRQPSTRPSAAPAPATSCWSPARVTRPARRSPAWCCPSTTATSCARSCERWRWRRDRDDAGRDRRGRGRRGARRPARSP